MSNTLTLFELMSYKGICSHDNFFLCEHRAYYLIKHPELLKEAHEGWADE